jgi:hypothetical protein
MLLTYSPSCLTVTAADLGWYVAESPWLNWCIDKNFLTCSFFSSKPTDHLPKEIGELSFRQVVLSIKLRKDAIAVALRDRVYVYHLGEFPLSAKRLAHIEFNPQQSSQSHAIDLNLLFIYCSGFVITG